MSTYLESGLTFSFPKSWRVIKFDEHRFYRYVNGIGLKGVDFIGLKEDGQLLLIEVKNYADRFPQDGVLPSTALLEDPVSYAEQIAQKFDDSFQLIDVIHQYYSRKFWFRKIAVPLLPWLPKKWIIQYDWAFWYKAYQDLSQQPQQVDMIWWMELGPEVTEDQKSLLHLQLLRYFVKYYKVVGQFVSIKDRHSAEKEILVNS